MRIKSLLQYAAGNDFPSLSYADLDWLYNHYINVINSDLSGLDQQVNKKNDTHGIPYKRSTIILYKSGAKPLVLVQLFSPNLYHVNALQLQTPVCMH